VAYPFRSQWPADWTCDTTSCDPVSITSYKNARRSTTLRVSFSVDSGDGANSDQESNALNEFLADTGDNGLVSKISTAAMIAGIDFAPTKAEDVTTKATPPPVASSNESIIMIVIIVVAILVVIAAVTAAYMCCVCCKPAPREVVISQPIAQPMAGVVMNMSPAPPPPAHGNPQGGDAYSASGGGKAPAMGHPDEPPPSYEAEGKPPPSGTEKT